MKNSEFCGEMSQGFALRSVTEAKTSRPRTVMVGGAAKTSSR